MEAARKWVEGARVLDKQSTPDLAKLPPRAQIAQTAAAHLADIQHELAANPLEPSHKDLIAIAVDDMKIVTGLMKLVVVFGIYPYMPKDSMVPLQPRIPAWKLPEKEEMHVPNLHSIVRELTAIITEGDDLASLILISPFLVDLVAAAAEFPTQLTALLTKIPTFNLYKVLIPLRSLPRPQHALVHALGEVPIQRKDAVRTLIELVIQPKDQVGEQKADLASSVRAAQILASIPEVVPRATYIQAVGVQLFDLLAGRLAGPTVAEASALLTASLSQIQPRFLGELRNLLVRPFEVADISARSALAALLRLGETRDARDSSFFAHVAARAAPAIWILINSHPQTDVVDSASTVVLAHLIDAAPEKNMTAIVSELVGTSLPKSRLEWHEAERGRPRLVEAIGSRPHPAPQQRSLIQRIDSRLDVLVTVLAKVSDSTATLVLSFLLQWYTKGISAANPVTSVALVKTIDRLAKDPNLRPKLFSNAEEIVSLSFKLITANITRIRSPTSRLDTLAIDDRDSDDEDEGGEEGAGKSNSDKAESLGIIEMSLSLLGSALMESLGSGDDGQASVSAGQLRVLKTLLEKPYPEPVRSKAEFALQLLDGSRREQKEVNLENDGEVLKAALAALNEPLVPSRAYGLHLISKLVERRAIPLTTAMKAYIRELRDDDSYVYLNAIKGIEGAARVGNSSEVLDLLLPAIRSNQASEAALDAALRAREALVRIVSPGTATRLSGDLVETLLADLRASARTKRDMRFRLSSCSILGIVISQYPHSLSASQENDAADCALGILRHEREPGEQPLQKAAVILALDIVNAVNEGAFKALSRRTLSSLTREIASLVRRTDDQVLLEHCRAVMDIAPPV